MSGECKETDDREQCLLFDLCSKCHKPVYRSDLTCIHCLVNESKELIKKTDRHIKSFKEKDVR